MDRLSDDVLLEIFRYDVDQLVANTHVCRQWRLVALGFPLFWSAIDVSHSRDRLLTYLLRSRWAPVSLSATLCASQKDCRVCIENTLLALGYVSHARTLRITAQDRLLSDEDRIAFANALSTPMPVLRTLDLNFSRCGGYLYLPDFARSSSQTQTQLRKISLSDVALPWTPTTFHSLSHLSLKISNFGFRYSDVSLVIEPMELLDILRASPRLEHLDINGLDSGLLFSGRRRTSGFPCLPSELNMKIPLPSLTSVTLDNLGLHRSLQFLELIEPSPNANCHIVLPYSDPGDPMLQTRIREIFKATLGPLEGAEQRSARLSLTEESVELCVSKFVVESAPGNDLVYPRLHHKGIGKVTFTMRLQLPDASSPYGSRVTFIPYLDELIAHFLVALHESGRGHVTFFGLKDESRVLRFEWARVFAALPFVRYMDLGFALNTSTSTSATSTITSNSPRPLFRKEALCSLVASLSPSPSSSRSNFTFPFPRLSHISLEYDKAYLAKVPAAYVREAVGVCLGARRGLGAGTVRVRCRNMDGGPFYDFLPVAESVPVGVRSRAGCVGVVSYGGPGCSRSAGILAT